MCWTLVETAFLFSGIEQGLPGRGPEREQGEFPEQLTVDSLFRKRQSSRMRLVFLIGGWPIFCKAFPTCKNSARG
jgi:hypothetical protein